MHGNDGSGNIPDRDEWETPKELFDKLNEQYNFVLDCCAKMNNAKAPLFSDNFKLWNEPNLMCWMNPPFSKANEMFDLFFKLVNTGVAIYRCDNLETKIWQDVILPNSDWIFIPKGRVVYEGMNGNGSRFPSALIGVGVNPPSNIEGVYLKKG